MRYINVATINFANFTNLQTHSSFKNFNCTFRCRAENFGRDEDWKMIWNDDIVSVVADFIYLMSIGVSVIDVMLI